MTGQANTGCFEDDRQHLLHPFAEFPRFLQEGSRFFDRADGAWIYGPGGKRYLDGIGGLWCVNIGYGRPDMVQGIADQAANLPYYNTFTDMSSEPAATLAATLGRLAPGDLNRVFFTTGGSMAVDTAVRLAHYYHHACGRPSKKLILAREDSYHGSTYLAASISGIVRNRVGFHHLAEGETRLVHHRSCPNLYRAPMSCCMRFSRRRGGLSLRIHSNVCGGRRMLVCWTLFGLRKLFRVGVVDEGSRPGSGLVRGVAETVM